MADTPEWMKLKPKQVGALDHQVREAVVGVQQQGMGLPPWEQARAQAPPRPPQMGGVVPPQFQQPMMQQQQQQPGYQQSQQVPPWMQPRPQQMPQQMPPPVSPMSPGIMVPPGMPAMAPGVGKKGVLPSQKKKRLLYVLIGVFVVTAIATIVTGLYFYFTYVKGG